MNKWKTCTINDLGRVIGGATPSTKKPENYENGNIAWITPKDLAGFSGRYISNVERNITEQGLKSCSAQLIPKHSILFSSRAPIGYIAIAANEVCTNQGFKSIVPNDGIDYLFLYYLLKYNKKKIESLGSGTTFKEVSGSTMKSIQVTIPETIEEQRKISTILSLIDDKIEENEKINKNLEQQAKEIYNNMIINNEKNSFSSAMLSDVATIIMGQSPKSDTYNKNKSGTVFFQGCSEFGFRFPTHRLFTTAPKRMAKTNDILISVRAPVGNINIAHEDCCIGRGLSSIKSKNGYQSYLLYTMFYLRKQFEIFNGEGTVFGSINQNDLNTMPIMIPPKDIIEQFEEIVSPIDETIRNNYNEICNLNYIRESLLPKLMSGEIDVSNIDF